MRIVYTNITVASPPVLEPADHKEQESDVEGTYLMLTASWVLGLLQMFSGDGTVPVIGRVQEALDKGI